MIKMNEHTMKANELEKNIFLKLNLTQKVKNKTINNV